MISLYEDRLARLANVRAILGGGGWMNKHSWPLVQLGLRSTPDPVSIYMLPVTDDEPTNELAMLAGKLTRRRQGRSKFRILGPDDLTTWPSPDELRGYLERANLFIVPGGNFSDFMIQVGSSPGCSRLLSEVFRNGRLQVVGSSCGTVSWFDWVQTADLPASRGGGIAPRYWVTRGLGVLPGFVCAHYNQRNPITGQSRAEAFQTMLMGMEPGTIGFGIDTQAALVYDQGTVRVVSRDPAYTEVQRIMVGPSGELLIDRIRASDPPMTLADLYFA